MIVLCVAALLLQLHRMQCIACSLHHLTFPGPSVAPLQHDAKHFFFVHHITSGMAAESATVLQRFEEGRMSTQGGGWRGASSCQRESNSHLGGIGEEGNSWGRNLEAAGGSSSIVKLSSQRLSQVQLTSHICGQEGAWWNGANLLRAHLAGDLVAGSWREAVEGWAALIEAEGRYYGAQKTLWEEYTLAHWAAQGHNVDHLLRGA